MSRTNVASRTQPKPFIYRTSLGEVKGRCGSLHSETKPSLHVTSPTEFGGDAGAWTPEDLFVAAIESCLMLTFVGLAEKRGLQFASYASTAEGLLKWDQQSYRFTRVVVAPVITLLDEESIVAAREIIERAHDTCLIANSARCEVIVEPSLTVRR